MPVGRLGERAELLDRVPEDHRALLRARYVRDGEGKLTRPGGEAGNSLVERPEPADRVEEGVQRVRIVIELPLFRLGVDQTQALEGVVLRYREVDIEKRVAVSELALLLLAGVEADRALDPQVVRREAAALDPAPEPARHHSEHDVVHGHSLPGVVLDPLQPLERESGPRDLSPRPDVLVEGRGGSRPELAP